MICSGFDGDDKNVYMRKSADLLSLNNNWLYALLLWHPLLVTNNDFNL
jgi:hypothetical protein